MTNYSTLAKIRNEAGFTGNANVLDATITNYFNAANAHINGIVGRVYSLPFDSTPPLIELIETKLAAGHLMLEQYGEQAEGTSFDGKDKVKWAENMLRLIEDGLIELVDASGVVFTKRTRVTMKGSPDNNSGTDRTADADKDDPPLFQIGDKF